MSSLRRLLFPAIAIGLAAALLIPSAADAGRPGRNCDRQPNDRMCQMFEKRREAMDRQRGITPACRAAANRYSLGLQTQSRAKSAQKSWKSALKKAKSDKAKKKAKKGLKKAKRQYKKASASLPGLKAGYDSACAGARVKPF